MTSSPMRDTLTCDAIIPIIFCLPCLFTTLICPILLPNLSVPSVYHTYVSVPYFYPICLSRMFITLMYLSHLSIQSVYPVCLSQLRICPIFLSNLSVVCCLFITLICPIFLSNCLSGLSACSVLSDCPIYLFRL